MLILFTLSLYAQGDSTSPGLEYTYDGNGNLTSDANKGITLIEYDDHNMPRRIQFTNGNAIVC